MARGFESKSVADQQEEAQNRNPQRDGGGGDPTKLPKRRKLELARADTLRQMQVATADGHKEMLRRALVALDKELAALQ
jgi:hypothetical protein